MFGLIYSKIVLLACECNHITSYVLVVQNSRSSISSVKKKEVYVLPIEQILGISRDIVMSFYEFALANEFNPIIRISCVSKSNCSIGRKLFIMSIIGHLSLQLATTLTQRVFAPLSFQLRDARRAGRWRLFSFNFFSRQTLMTQLCFKFANEQIET